MKTVTELVPGIVYKHTNGNIVRWEERAKDRPYIGTNAQEGRLFKYNGCFNDPPNKFTLASIEEVIWLEACIEANEFISFEEVFKPKIKKTILCWDEQEEEMKTEMKRVYRKGNIDEHTDNKRPSTEKGFESLAQAWLPRNS